MCRRPMGDTEAPFAMLVTTLEYDSYLGRVLTGRIHTGTCQGQHAGEGHRARTGG